MPLALIGFWIIVALIVVALYLDHTRGNDRTGGALSAAVDEGVRAGRTTREAQRAAQAERTGRTADRRTGGRAHPRTAPVRTGRTGGRTGGGAQVATADPIAAVDEGQAWEGSRGGHAAEAVVRGGIAGGLGAGRWGAVIKDATVHGVKAVPVGWREGRAIKDRIAAGEPAIPRPTPPADTLTADPDPIPSTGSRLAPAPTPAPSATPTGDGPMQAVEIKGIRIPAEIDDHVTLINIQKALQAVIADDLGAAKGFIGQLITGLGNLATLLVQVKQIPGRLGANIGAPTARSAQETADQAVRARQAVLTAIEQLRILQGHLQPLGDSAAATQKAAVAAVG